MPLGALKYALLLLAVVLLGLTPDVLAHDVDENTRQFVGQNSGVQFIPFLYIGAKHMVTGYDHLLFLIGVIFFLYRPREVLLYVTMFTIGHSVTLLFGVLNSVQINAFLIDAIIGLSVIYKGFDNLGGFKRFFGVQPNTMWAVLIFGLFHGFGLASKLQELAANNDGLLANLVAFNIGVELGQFAALGIILIVINFWRKLPSFERFSLLTNTALMSAGFMLMGYQLTGYFVN